MQLWTDYEGVTIDGAFPLNKLLLPEGRSAFFSTANGKGDPVVLRLIECHFDEDEILARWRSIDALNHPNFLKLERFGKIEIDGSPVVYAAFEKVDANLAGVLDKGHLNVKETAQLASSLAAALEVLHSNGFVHQHVTAGSIFAVGEVVKLRSDCIREAPEGEAGLAAKKRDIHDLATVLLQALTQRQSLDGLPESAVPAPFDKIVRYGLNGTWGLEEICSLLDGRRKTVTKDLQSELPFPAPSNARSTAVPPKPASVPQKEEPQTWAAKPFRSATRQELWEDSRENFFLANRKWLGIGGLVALLFLLSGWLLVHAWGGHAPAGEQVAHASAHPAASQPPSAAPQHANPVNRMNVSVPVTHAPAIRAQWRVIAYTYHRQDEAAKKAQEVSSRHPDLQAGVFSANGRAPYLVSIGGVMGKDEAFALAHRARKLGLPHDTYAQNYSH